MKSQFVTEFITRIAHMFSADELNMIRITLVSALEDYNLTKSCTDVTQFQYELPYCYKAFLVAKKIEGKKDTTLDSYKNYLEHFLYAFKKPLESVTADDIRLYLYKTQQERKITNRSLDMRRSCLHNFFSWISNEGYIDKNPMLTVKPIKHVDKPVEPLTDIELEKVRLACKDIRERAMIETMYSSGCRLSELVNLDVSDINFETREIKLFGKGDKHRKSYISAKTILLLKEYLNTRKEHQEHEALFLSQYYPFERLKRNTVESLVHDLGVRAGMPHLHPHQLRHTFATDCLHKKMDITQIQKLLGHVNVATTLIYAKVDDDDIKNAYNKCIN